MTAAQAGPNWLAAIRRYLVAVTAGNLVWEMAQMPLYTLWYTGTMRDIARAILHCTAGDLAIATVTLICALAVVGSPDWPERRSGAVMAAVIVGAAGYTIYSEYLNTVVRRSWAYTAWMPALPWIGTGLTPFAQWLTVPAVALSWAGRGVLARAQRSPKKSSRSVT